MEIIEKLGTSFDENLYKTFSTDGILSFDFSLENKKVIMILKDKTEIHMNGVIFNSCTLGVEFEDSNFVDLFFDFYSDGEDCYSYLLSSGYGFKGEDWRSVNNIYHIQFDGDVYGDVFCMSKPMLRVLSAIVLK